MKSGVSLQQMLTEVKRQSESKEDYLIAPNRLRMESYGKEMFLHLSDDSGTELIEPMTITGIAHRQIGTHLRIPAAYYDRMREERPDLLAYNANTWFKQESSQRMLRTLDGSARAYLSNRYRRMFVSHYIDIDTYYTDASLSFLTDGASRSEAPKYYCKWITDDDRNAYDTYLGLHQVNSKANFLYEGFRSICSLNGDVNDIDNLRKTSDKVNDTLFGVAASYSSYDAFDSWGGIYTVTQEIFKKTAESPETRLSDLYTDFFEDEDILRGIDSDIKAAALQSSFAMAGALLLGFVTGGLIEGVAECALWSLCDFGEAVLTSEIDVALTLQLRYSYHVREPARMYDYYMDSI